MDLSKHTRPLLLKGLINPIPGHMLLRKVLWLFKKLNKEMETYGHISPYFQTWLPQLASHFWMQAPNESAIVSQVFCVNSSNPDPSQSSFFCLSPKHKIKNPNFVMQIWTCSWRSRWKQKLKPVSLLFSMALFHSPLINDVWEMKAQRVCCPALAIFPYAP